MFGNVGTFDRVLRALAGAALALYGIYLSGPDNAVLGWVMGLIGLGVLLTGVFGWCGIYSLLGLSTKKS